MADASRGADGVEFSHRLQADATFWTAWTEAEHSGDGEAQVLLALGPAFPMESGTEAAREHGRRCRVALASLDEAPSATRARLLATLAATQLAEPDQETARRTAALALDMAESLGDDVSIGYALVAHVITDLDPDTLGRRLTAARRILAIARQHADYQLASIGYFLRLVSLLENGDIQAIDAEMAPRGRAVDLFAELTDERHVGRFRCARALLDGDAPLAERLADEALEASRIQDDQGADEAWTVQLTIVRWMQGRERELEDLFRRAHEQAPVRAAWIAGLARCSAAGGRPGEAADAIASLGPLGSIPRDRHWLYTMALLSEAAFLLRDRGVAEELRDLLMPYSRRLVPVGLGIAVWGTVARPLGLLARTLGRDREAVAHFRYSVQLCTAARALPWLAESQLDLAEAITEAMADDATSHAEAVERIQRARSLGTELGLPHVAERADRLVERMSADSLSTPRAATRDESADTPDRARIGVLGAFEVVSAEGTVANWTSRKARNLLGILVAARGAPVARETIMNTLWPGESPELLANRFSVALAAVRRALDPARANPLHHYVRTDGVVVQLRASRLTIDVERFLALARAAIEAARSGAADAESRLAEALAECRGDAFADEPYAEWAEHLRQECRGVFSELSRLLARFASDRADHLLAANLHRQVLSIDPYDENAHLGLVAALERMGVHGQARASRRVYESRMSELT